MGEIDSIDLNGTMDQIKLSAKWNIMAQLQVLAKMKVLAK